MSNLTWTKLFYVLTGRPEYKAAIPYGGISNYRKMAQQMMEAQQRYRKVERK